VNVYVTCDAPVCVGVTTMVAVEEPVGTGMLALVAPDVSVVGEVTSVLVYCMENTVTTGVTWNVKLLCVEVSVTVYASVADAKVAGDMLPGLTTAVCRCASVDCAAAWLHRLSSSSSAANTARANMTSTTLRQTRRSMLSV